MIGEGGNIICAVGTLKTPRTWKQMKKSSVNMGHPRGGEEGSGGQSSIKVKQQKQRNKPNRCATPYAI